MGYADKEKQTLYNTPVTELENVDINNLVPNTLYLYEHNDVDVDHEDDVEKAVVEFINIIGTNRIVVGKMLTDRNGNITDNQFNEFMVDPSERDHYKFYKKREHPTGLHEEIKKGTDLKSGLHPKSHIQTLSKLAYDQLILPQKDDYYSSGTPLIRGGLKRKVKKTTKRNRNRKRSRSLRGKTKTKTKTRKQK
jgi:hypothetical protein